LQFNEATLPEGYQQVQEDAEKIYNFPNGIVLVVERDEEISVLCRPIEIQTFYGPNFGRWLMYNDNSAFPDRPTLLEAWERFYAWTRAVNPFIGIPGFVHEVNTEHGLPLFLTARSVVDFFHQIWSKVPRPEPRYLLELPADVDVARGITVVPDGIIYRPLGKADARIVMFQTGKNLRIPDWVQGDTDYKYHRVLDIGAPFEPVVIIRGFADDTDMFLTNANLKPEFLYQIHSFSNGWLCYKHMDGTSWIVHLRRKAEGLWSECAIAGNFFFVDADTVVEMDRLLVDDILMTDFYPLQLYAGEKFQLIQKTCAHCTEPARQLCSKCEVAYCSTVCQRSDWLQHRSVCKPLEIK
jgi:MYND finger